MLLLVCVAVFVPVLLFLAVFGVVLLFLGVEGLNIGFIGCLCELPPPGGVSACVALGLTLFAS